MSMDQVLYMTMILDHVVDVSMILENVLDVTVSVRDHASRSKNKRRWCSSSYGLFSTCRGEKYVQYWTVILRQYYYVNPSKCKCKMSLTWGGDHYFTPVWSHVGNHLAHFLQATGPTPSPSPPPFPPHRPTYVTQFLSMKMTSACWKPLPSGTMSMDHVLNITMIMDHV